MGWVGGGGRVGGNLREVGRGGESETHLMCWPTNFIKNGVQKKVHILIKRYEY